MYTALAILVSCIIIGRLFNKWMRRLPLKQLTMAAILLLLFLLGVAIGSNDDLFARLPELGWQALVLMLFCIAGSIICSAMITPFLKSNKKNAR